MSKQLIFKYIALLLVFSTLLSVSIVPVSAASTSQMKNEIERLEEESEKLEKEISKLKGQKAEQQKIKNTLTAQINNTQAEISA